MAHELKPGEFVAIFERLSAKAGGTGAAALTALALAVERRAKQDLALTTHTRKTPTPASPGGPPALVSGTLRRSVTHTRPTVLPGMVEVRVGTATGFYPPYGKKRTPSSKYGFYLETGLRNGDTYPWLRPAFQAVVASGDVGRYVAAQWRHLGLSD